MGCLLRSELLHLAWKRESYATFGEAAEALGEPEGHQRENGENSEDELHLERGVSLESLSARVEDEEGEEAKSKKVQEGKDANSQHWKVPWKLAISAGVCIGLKSLCDQQHTISHTISLQFYGIELHFT